MLKQASRSVIFLSALIAGCQPSTLFLSPKQGVVHLQLAMGSEDRVVIALINDSSGEVEVNGLMAIGYVQSPITYEVKGDANSSVNTSGNVSELVPLEAFKVRLSPGDFRGASFKKQDLAELIAVEQGECREVRAIYTPPSATYTQLVQPSDYIRVCF